MSNRRRPPDEPSKALVPATNKAPRSFFDSFSALTDAFDAQVKVFKELDSAWCKRNQRVDLHDAVADIDHVRFLWTSAREGASDASQKMKALWAIRAGNAKSIDIAAPSATWLLFRIREMTKAWHNVNMSVAEMEYMAERLAVEKHHAMVWESVFRGLEEDSKIKKPPLKCWSV